MEKTTENTSGTALAMAGADGAVISEQYQQAVSLHREIMTNIEVAAASMIAFCKCLKEMRDGRFYIELGYETFEDYVENAVGLKQRQAYNYIATFERLPATILQSHAQLGITKLEMLSRVPSMEREELLDSDDLAEMSTRELRIKIDELTKQCEQLTIQIESQPVTDDNADPESTAERLKVAEETASNLASEVEDLRGKLEAAATAALDNNVEAAIEKAKAEAGAAAQQETQDAIKKAKEEAKAEAVKAAEKQVAKAKEAGAREAEQRFRQTLDAIEGEKAEAMRKAAELEKQLKVSSDSDALRFSFYFEELQSTFNQINGVIVKLKASGRNEDAEKYTAALVKALDMLKNKVIQG